jgi:hypothetical protein
MQAGGGGLNDAFGSLNIGIVGTGATPLPKAPDPTNQQQGMPPQQQQQQQPVGSMAGGLFASMSGSMGG